MTEIPFIERMRNNSNEAIRTGKHYVGTPIEEHIKTEHFKNILSEIEEASHRGKFSIDKLQSANDPKVIWEDMDALRAMNFNIYEYVLVPGGDRINIGVSWLNSGKDLIFLVGDEND